MQTKKVFLSFFLLLVYTLGFAHSLIPHCHVSGVQHLSHTTAQSHFHHHTHQSHSDHDGHPHVAHGDHLDKNLYDFIVCVLTNMEHHGNDNEFLHFEAQKQSRVKTTDSTKKIKSPAIIYTIPSELSLGFNTKLRTIVLSKDLLPTRSTIPLRGPPSSFCG